MSWRRSPWWRSIGADPPILSLGNRLKEARTRQGLTQAELAARVQVSRKTINTVENRVFVPSVLLALRLAQALGTTVEALFQLDEDDG